MPSRKSYGYAAVIIGSGRRRDGEPRAEVKKEPEQEVRGERGREDESFGRRQIREKARKRVARRFFLRIRNQRAVFVLPYFFLSFCSFFFLFHLAAALLRCNLAATRRLQLPSVVACLTSSPRLVWFGEAEKRLFFHARILAKLSAARHARRP